MYLLLFSIFCTISSVLYYFCIYIFKKKTKERAERHPKVEAECQRKEEAERREIAEAERQRKKEAERRRRVKAERQKRGSQNSANKGRRAINEAAPKKSR